MILAAIAFALLWAVLFFVALLIDEDVNHWNWPSDSGPGALAHIRMAAFSGAVAAAAVGLLWWLVARW